jgi:surfeit locus 1 family protein
MRRYLAPLAFGAVGVAILIGLGLWQVQRLSWKAALLARIEARIGDAPVALPALPDPVRDEYLAVRAEGEIGGPALHVLVSRKEIGAGWRIVAPFETGGRRVLLDRGFVRDGAQDAPHAGGPASVTGNLHWPDDRNSATPANDAVKNIWFARDLGQMAAALGAEPVLIVARAPTGDGIEPLPVTTEGIPNDHLSYAITWFSLALIWAGMTVYLVWRMARRTD